MLGAVLAGGASRRFGSDKAMAVFDGHRLIDRVVAALSPQVDALVICGRQLEGAVCIDDRPARHLGPLGGLNAALHHGLDLGFAGVISVPCDAPFLPDDLVARLRMGKAAAFVRSLPVIGHWPCALEKRLDAHVTNSDDRSMRRWAALAGAVAIDMDHIGNLNEPDDLAAMTRSTPSNPITARARPEPRGKHHA